MPAGEVTPNMSLPVGTASEVSPMSVIYGLQPDGYDTRVCPPSERHDSVIVRVPVTMEVGVPAMA